MSEFSAALRTWFAEQMPNAADVRLLAETSRPRMGCSNETLVIPVGWSEAGRSLIEEFVVRLPPSAVEALLSPYDITRQFHVMRCLHGSPVPVPKVLWLEEHPEVLGRPFFVMEKIDAVDFESVVPAEFRVLAHEQQREMVRRAVVTLGEVANLDWQAAGIDFLGEPASAFDLLQRWTSYLERWRIGEMPAFQVVMDWLRNNEPVSSGRVSLLHGDAKWGNFMWSENRAVRSLNDWEMAGLGDPLVDLAYFLSTTFMFGDQPWPMAGGLSRDEIIETYSRTTGLDVPDLRWFEVLANFKLAAITYRMYHLFLTGATTDLRYSLVADTVGTFLRNALNLVGADPATDPGLAEIPADMVAAAITSTLTEAVIPAVTSQQAAAQAGLVAHSVGLLAARVSSS